MKFTDIYPLYGQKADRKNRTREEVDQIICWLTGYDRAACGSRSSRAMTCKPSFRRRLPFIPMPPSSLALCAACALEEIADPLMRKIRYLDKLIDELAKGKAMEKILRQDAHQP
jgi:hypothetical protein